MRFDFNSRVEDVDINQPTNIPIAGIPHFVAANVASVPHYSPFRYPGGKTWLANVVREWLRDSGVDVLHEPFAGGGSMSLLAVIEGFVERAVLYEMDHAVSAVWKTMLSGDAEWLTDRIRSFRPTPENVAEVLLKKSRKTRTLAFQTLLKNRCRRGGVLAGGAGLLSKGERGNGVSSRWYPETLAKRVMSIYQHRAQIEFVECDSMNVIPKLVTDSSIALFVDPPYPKLMERGVKPLYAHFRLDHEKLFNILSKSNANFLLTYDDSEYVRNLISANGFSYKSIDMRNSSAIIKTELLIGKSKN